MEPFHMGFGPGMMGVGFSFVLLLALWSIFWKGLALWHSARRAEYWWFFAVLIFNTFGILELIYLFGFAKIKADALFTLDGQKTAEAGKEPPADAK